MKPELSIVPEREPVGTRKRKTIPLATRYEVLRRQCAPEIVEKIEADGGKLKDRYSKLLRHARCAISDDELIVKGCEFDHKKPRALGGDDSPQNIQALTPAAHRRKTEADKAIIDKANAQGERTGQYKRRRENGPQLQSRGFDKRFKKKMNGKVEERND